MDEKQKLQLQQMISENAVEDRTDQIRLLKHSSIIRQDVNELVLLKQRCKDAEELNLEGMINCNFLFTYYTDIYNKIRKDEIDYLILFQFLDVLKKIEDGVLGQHDGSYEVGLLLKKLYIDSALKKADKLNALYGGDNDNAPVKESLDISWKNYKAIHMK
jgi:hypothetical protein